MEIKSQKSELSKIKCDSFKVNNYLQSVSDYVVKSIKSWSFKNFDQNCWYARSCSKNNISY